MIRSSKRSMLAAVVFVALTAGMLLVLSTSGGTSGGTANSSGADQGAKWSAKWAFRPANTKELALGSQLIVTGEVVRIRPGEPLVTPGAADVAPIPTQIITLRTVSTIKGKAPAEIEFSKTGTQDHWIEDDPPFAVGSTYMMFLERRGKAPFLPVGPDGRIEITSDGDLKLDANSKIEQEVMQINGSASKPEATLTDIVDGS